MKKALALAGLLLTVDTSPARADLFGGDVAVLVSILNQSIQTYNQIRQQVEQVKRQSEYWQQTLKNLDPTSFSQVIGLYNSGLATYNGLLADTQAMGYAFKSIDQNVRRLFPPEKDLQKATYTDYDQLYGAWQTELRNSAQVAMKVQANAERLQENARVAQSLMNASKGGHGEVQQLQAIVQMLGVVQAQLTTLTQTISTAERVTSGMAASSANEKIMDREARRRRRERIREPSVQVHRRLP